MDIICPAGRYFRLKIDPEPLLLPVEKSIRPLAPGETFEAGEVELRGIPGCELLGKPAPELQIGDWVNGRETRLAELRGKVVLLDFGGYGADPVGDVLRNWLTCMENTLKTAW